MKYLKLTKTASDYITNVYGKRTFARAVDVNDTESILDLMQDFSDYNLIQAKHSELVESVEELLKELSFHGYQHSTTIYKAINLLKEIKCNTIS